MFKKEEYFTFSYSSEGSAFLCIESDLLESNQLPSDTTESLHTTEEQ